MNEMSNPEGRLCGELAASIARYVTKLDRGTKPGCKGAAFYHYSNSTFEAATLVLKSFELLTPVPSADIAGESWYCHHALTMDADAMPDFLERHVWKDDPRLPELLEAFVDIACSYDALPSGRAQFPCPDTYCSAARMLERTGYLENVGGQYRWTDKIAPAMRAVYLWNEDGIDLAELEEAETEREAEEALRTMPDAIKEAFMESPGDVVSWQAVLSKCWKDGRWQKAEPGPVFLSGLGLARRLAEKFEARYAPGKRPHAP